MATSTIPQFPQSTGLVGTELIEIAVPTTPPPASAYTSARATSQQVGDLAFRRLFPAAMLAVLDGQGLTLQPKVWVYLTVPFNATIAGVRLLANGGGTVTVDFWKCSYAQFDAGFTHPVAADSICGGSPAQIVGNVTKGQAVLTNWATQLNQDAILAVELPSVSTNLITLLTVAIDLTRNSAS